MSNRMLCLVNGTLPLGSKNDYRLLRSGNVLIRSRFVLLHSSPVHTFCPAYLDSHLSGLFIVYMSCPIGKGIGETQLAEATNNGNASISVIETGKMEPDAINLSLIANKLQKSLTYFIPPYARIFSSLGGLNDDDIELINQFWRMSKGPRKLVIGQVDPLQSRLRRIVHSSKGICSAI